MRTGLRFSEAVVIVLSRMPESSSRRELYRIIYPLVERPTFEVGRYLYEVIDCSEKGLRYEVRDRRPPTVGTQLGGSMQFLRGAEIEVVGEVIRSRGGVVVLALDPPLPFAEVLAEQRYLRAKGYTLRE
jgi:hypothetical protein